MENQANIIKLRSADQHDVRNDNNNNNNNNNNTNNNNNYGEI